MICKAPKSERTESGHFLQVAGGPLHDPLLNDQHQIAKGLKKNTPDGKSNI